MPRHRCTSRLGLILHPPPRHATAQLVIWACCWRCLSAQPWRYRRSGRRRWIDHVCRAQEEGLHLALAEEEARSGQGAPQHLTHRGLPCLRPAQAATARLPELCRLEGQLKRVRESCLRWRNEAVGCSLGAGGWVVHAKDGRRKLHVPPRRPDWLLAHQGCHAL